MPYSPPSLGQLHLATSTLLAEFNKRMRHYQPPTYEELVKKSKDMRGKYLAQVAEKPDPWLRSMPGLGSFVPKHQPNSQHLDEIDCINHLVNELPEAGPESEQRIQAHHTLLGALFYRYLAIAVPYRETYTGLFWSVCGWAIEKTAMHATLSDILGITDDNQMDDRNIAIACGAYLKFLQNNGGAVKRDARYVPSSEVDFFVRLKGLVKKHETSTLR